MPTQKWRESYFDATNEGKCERVRQAMPRVPRVGDQRMSWATYGKEVAKLAGFNNPAAVGVWMQRNAMSLKPDWVDPPAKKKGSDGPFGNFLLSQLTADNCVVVEGDVAYSCQKKKQAIRLLDGDTENSRRFRKQDYGNSMEKATAAALKHTKQVAARTRYYLKTEKAAAEQMQQSVKEGGLGPLPTGPQMHGHTSQQVADGVYVKTYPGGSRSGYITYNPGGLEVDHGSDLAAARRAAARQERRRARKGREENNRTLVAAAPGDVPNLPYNPVAFARGVEAARRREGGDGGQSSTARRAAIASGVGRSPSRAVPPPTLRLNALVDRQDGTRLESGTRVVLKTNQGPLEPPPTLSPAPSAPRRRIRTPTAPPEFKDAIDGFNDAIGIFYGGRLAPATFPANPHQLLGIRREKRRDIAPLLGIAQELSQTVCCGVRTFDDMKILDSLYGLLRGQQAVLWDAFQRIYGVSFADDVDFSGVADLHGLVAVAVPTGITPMSIAVAPLPVVALLRDQPFHNGHRKYFSASAKRAVIADASSGAAAFAGERDAIAFLNYRLGDGNADALSADAGDDALAVFGELDDSDDSDDDARMLDDDELRSRLALRREELAAQTAVVRSKMEAAHHAREAARHAFAELRREAKKEHLLKLDIEDLTSRFARAETGEDA